jgi:murein DD-endopeptidase MepM/ murein hydrolase activator NlpD
MKRLFTFLLRPYRGSNRVSLALRRRIKKLSVRQALGVPLAGVAFFAAVIVPGATDFASNLEVLKETQVTVVEVVPTQAKLQWPMSKFGLSQRFHAGHPGIDLTAPLGTSIFPIAEGVVEWANTDLWGYGKHVLIAHADNIKSLYAHLSYINVKVGDTITRDTQVGEVGSSGWATGNHLHLEIYQDATPVNPLEVLPALPKI